MACPAAKENPTKRRGLVGFLEEYNRSSETVGLKDERLAGVIEDVLVDPKNLAFHRYLTGEPGTAHYTF
jgi:hypothetical protein